MYLEEIIMTIFGVAAGIWFLCWALGFLGSIIGVIVNFLKGK